MRNPLRTEDAAFRFVFATIGYFALIAAATVVGNAWWGFGTFVALTMAAGYWLFRTDDDGTRS